MNLRTNKEDRLTELEEVQFPNTKLARNYLKKQNIEQEKVNQGETFQEAYVELTRWVFHNSKSLVNSSSDCPHAIDCQVMIDQLEASPPDGKVRPDLFGRNSWKDLVEQELDVECTGYITRTDFSKFWGRFHVRHAFLKNRNPKPLRKLSTLGGEVLNSMYNVAEEGLLRSPCNAKRICSLGTKYVGLLDLEVEQEDKEFLYALGKRDTIAWLRQKAEQHKTECACV